MQSLLWRRFLFLTLVPALFVAGCGSGPRQPAAETGSPEASPAGAAGWSETSSPAGEPDRPKPTSAVEQRIEPTGEPEPAETASPGAGPTSQPEEPDRPGDEEEKVGGSSTPYVDLRIDDSPANFMAAARDGVVVSEQSGGVAIRLAESGLQQGDQQLAAGQSAWYGTLESPPIRARRPFDTLVPSWNAQTPPGTWIQLELRAFKGDDQGQPILPGTDYYSLGIWASGSETIERRSVARQRDEQGEVSTDTLLLHAGPAYSYYQYRLTLFTTDQQSSPAVSLIGVMAASSQAQPAEFERPSDRQAWGVELAVPQRSQMLYPDGGEVWCSPTSTSMVLAYWGHSVPVPEAAAATYDYVYEGNGNWPFNTAWAASFGLTAYVTRMGSLAEVEEWISAGVPVIVSYAYGVGELPGSPIPSTEGHVMVIRGFDAAGNVIANDPAGASDQAVRILYDRITLERLWLAHSGGTVYLIYPRGHPAPAL